MCALDARESTVLLASIERARREEKLTEIEVPGRTGSAGPLDQIPPVRGEAGGWGHLGDALGEGGVPRQCRPLHAAPTMRRGRSAREHGMDEDRRPQPRASPRAATRRENVARSPPSPDLAPRNLDTLEGSHQSELSLSHARGLTRCEPDVREPPMQLVLAVGINGNLAWKARGLDWETDEGETSGNEPQWRCSRARLPRLTRRQLARSQPEQPRARRAAEPRWARGRRCARSTRWR